MFEAEQLMMCLIWVSGWPGIKATNSVDYVTYPSFSYVEIIVVGSLLMHSKQYYMIMMGKWSTWFTFD